MQTTINKQAVQASFSKAAKHYDQFADLQREIGHRLIEMIPRIESNNCQILDLGCGTGYFSEILSNHFLDNSDNPMTLTCFDLSPDMLLQAEQRNIPQGRFVEGDIDALPFTDNKFDLVFSNLVVQWSEKLSASLKQTKNALKKGGVFCFTTLLNGTLNELQQAWKSVDDNEHVNGFLPESAVVLALKEAGFNHVTVITETRIKKFPEVISVMRALKGIGANHVHNGAKVQLSGRHLLQKIEQGYQPFKDQHGLFNLTYQVCYVVATNDN